MKTIVSSSVTCKRLKYNSGELSSTTSLKTKTRIGKTLSIISLDHNDTILLKESASCFEISYADLILDR